MRCRGLRGATTAEKNTKEAILLATTELLRALVEANGFRPDDVAAIILTTTADLNAEFPAVAARKFGWVDVALMNAHEMFVSDAQERCIRVMVHVHSEKSPKEINNVYLRDAINLRKRGFEDEDQ